MRLNLHTYRSELKQSIIKRKVILDVARYPNDWAWLTYSLSKDGIDNNPLFTESLTALTNWAISEEALNQDRYLAGLGLCAYLTPDNRQRRILVDRIGNKLDTVLSKESGKFSVLNDPEQVYCIILGRKKNLSQPQQDGLNAVIERNIRTGRLVRQVLYVAAGLELGKPPKYWPILENRSGASPEDAISVLWLNERYRDRSKQDISILWKALENVSDALVLDSPAPADESLLPISNLSLAMLYEAVSKQTEGPDPSMLFDTYPLHPRVREITEHDFKNGSYVAAVEQATRVLNELIQHKSGLSDKNEGELVQAAMKSLNKRGGPLIRFNDFLQEESGKNEQTGLALIAEGVFKAFRNPKGHKPKDHPLTEISAFQALDQLVAISLLMERIKDAK